MNSYFTPNYNKMCFDQNIINCYEASIVYLIFQKENTAASVYSMDSAERSGETRGDKEGTNGVLYWPLLNTSKNKPC